MNWLKQALRSSIGKKIIMAVTGLGLFGFLIAHLIGNLSVFAGPEAINDYAKALRDLGGLLWVLRFGLLAIFVAHVRTAVLLTRENRAARPIPYGRKANLQSSYASRTMIITGLLIFGYLLFHLGHYTFHWTHPEFKELEGNVYQMMVMGFSSVPISLLYIVAMIVLGFHLHHGVASAMQTLGLNHTKYNSLRQGFSLFIAIVIAGGFISIPLAVLTGVVR